MKKLLLFVPLIFLLAGCSTVKTYKSSMAAGPARPADYPIPLYTENMLIPRPCKLIGQLSIGDTEFTLFGGSIEDEMKTLMQTAHEKGADVVQIVSIQKPDFSSAHYRLAANLLRYADKWETVGISENDFLKYLQTHRQTLDPIEGIWTDGSPDRIGIIKDTSRPGRDFIGFKLDAALASWQVGDKNMDIARDARPGGYRIKYYREDFELAKTSVVLDRGIRFNFIIYKGDEAAEMDFIKVGAPRPLN